MSKKKMRQPTKEELKKGKIAGKAFGGQRALTPGDKKGEMIYSRPDYYKGDTRVQVKSDVKGGRGKTNPPRVKPTPSKGQIQSAANKEKIAKAAKAANKRSAEANKYNPTKEEMFGSETKRPSNFGEIGKRQRQDKDIDMGYTTVALNGGGSVEDALKGKNKLSTSNNNQAKPPADYTKGLSNREIEIKMGIPNQSGMDTTSTDAEGPKKKKMGGGQVYKRGHGGKVIKNNMGGQDLVNACYDN